MNLDGNVNIALLENGLVVRDMRPGGEAWVFEFRGGRQPAVGEALTQAARLLGWSVRVAEIEPLPKEDLADLPPAPGAEGAF